MDILPSWNRIKNRTSNPSSILMLQSKCAHFRKVSRFHQLLLCKCFSEQSGWKLTFTHTPWHTQLGESLTVPQYIQAPSLRPDGVNFSYRDKKHAHTHTQAIRLMLFLSIGLLPLSPSHILERTGNLSKRDRQGCFTCESLNRSSLLSKSEQRDFFELNFLVFI